MRTKFITIIISALLMACQENSSRDVYHQGDKKDRVEEERFLLKPFIEDFLSSERVKSDAVTLECVKRNDTLKFTLCDSYPNLKEINFLGYTLFENHVLCFVGDTIPVEFASIQFNKIPASVIDQNKKIEKSKRLTIKTSEPLIQSIYFKGVHQIKCTVNR